MTSATCASSPLPVLAQATPFIHYVPDLGRKFETLGHEAWTSSGSGS